MSENLKDVLDQIEQGHLPPLKNPDGISTTRDGIGIHRYSSDGIETVRNNH